MHRSFRPLKPSTNLCTEYKSDQGVQKKWNKKIKTAKTGIDNALPEIQSHVQKKVKKKQLENERTSEIEHNNLMLKKRLKQIKKRSGSISNDEPGHVLKSLNREFRVRQLGEIDKENQNMVRRMEETQPVYNHIKDVCDYQENRDKYLNLSRHTTKLPPILQNRLQERQGQANNRIQTKIKSESKHGDFESSSLLPLFKCSSIAQFYWNRRGSRRASIKRTGRSGQSDNLHSAYAECLKKFVKAMYD